MSARPKALSREALRELDRRAIEDWGIPSFALMESAGRACAAEAVALLEEGAGAVPSGAVPSGAVPSGAVQVLCGPGNNGGDGFVVARTLKNRGLPADVLFVGSAEQLEGGSDDVGLNLQLWRGLGNEVVLVDDVEAVRRQAERLRSAPLLVDALFGTGLARDVRSSWAELVETANDAPPPRLAVDVPSGLDANTGEVLGTCVRADVTVTFVAPKLGFVRGEGPSHCGRVVVAEIGIPQAFVEEAAGGPERGS